MTLDQWLADAQADANRRGLPDLQPLLSGLATALAALRAAEWNDDAADGRATDGPRHEDERQPREIAGDGARDFDAAPGFTVTTADRGTAAAPLAPRAADGSTAPLHFWPIEKLAPLIASRTVASVDLTRACLDEIAARNDRLRAFITIAADDALAQARRLDEETARGQSRGPLHGIPISLKDLIDQRGLPTTAASRVREGHVAGGDAPVAARLRDAGAVLIGKTNLHEFAFGTTSDETAYGAVRHPHDERRSPGGSSGGSAAAIVSGMCVASVGTDTGGSIRIPSAACGLVGLKATHGEIPAAGVVPLSRSLDHVGPLARSVRDAWLLYLVLRGQPAAAAWPLPARAHVRGLRIGVPREYFHDLLDDDVRTRFAASLAWLRQAGAVTTEVTIRHAAHTGPVYLATSLPEAAAFHAESVTRSPERYTPNVRLRIEMGRYVLAEDAVRAARGREVLRAEVDAALEPCDVLALPTLPIPAPLIGAATVDVAGRQEPVRNMMLRLTQLFNLTGHPAVSLPCGLTPAGLPCGLQLVGRRHETEALLAVAAACEGLVTP